MLILDSFLIKLKWSNITSLEVAVFVANSGDLMNGTFAPADTEIFAIFLQSVFTCISSKILLFIAEIIVHSMSGFPLIILIFFFGSLLLPLLAGIIAIFKLHNLHESTVTIILSVYVAICYLENLFYLKLRLLKKQKD